MFYKTYSQNHAKIIIFLKEEWFTIIIFAKIPGQAGNDGKQAGNDGKQAGNDGKQAGNDGKQAGNGGKQVGMTERYEIQDRFGI